MQLFSEFTYTLARTDILENPVMTWHDPRHTLM